jgi:hypothetical protein
MENVLTHETQVRALTAILRDGGIDTSLYGVGKARTMQSLLKEILTEECYLVVAGRLITRHIRMAAVLIERDNYLLIESKQHMYPRDTRRAYDRVRNCPVCEKMYPNELPEQAIPRALKEELYLDEGSYAIHSILTDTEERLSDSYPGLTTVYTRYIAKVTLNSTLVDPIFSQREFSVIEYTDESRTCERLEATWTWMTIPAIRQLSGAELSNRCIDLIY